MNGRCIWFTHIKAILVFPVPGKYTSIGALLENTQKSILLLTLWSLVKGKKSRNILLPVFRACQVWMVVKVKKEISNWSIHEHCISIFLRQQACSKISQKPIPFYTVALHVCMVFLGFVSADIHKYFTFQITKLFGSWNEKATPVWVLLYLLQC